MIDRCSAEQDSTAPRRGTPDIPPSMGLRRPRRWPRQVVLIVEFAGEVHAGAEIRLRRQHGRGCLRSRPAAAGCSSRPARSGRAHGRVRPVERDGVVDDGHDIPSSSDFQEIELDRVQLRPPPISKRAGSRIPRRPPPDLRLQVPACPALISGAASPSQAARSTPVLAGWSSSAPVRRSADGRPAGRLAGAARSCAAGRASPAPDQT